MNVEKAIMLAIDNVKKEGLTDIFPTPFEVDLLKNNDDFKNEVFKQIKSRLMPNELGKLKIHPLGHVLFPKKEAYDFRKAALLQPLDTIIYLAIILQFADEIEKNRIPKSKKIVFSYRFKPKDGYLFDARYNYTSFNHEVSKQIKKKHTKVLVKCDISNFYDRLNLHRLESTLLSLPNINSRLINLTNNLLLFWANRDSYGLPTGGNASRILAESALISLDDYLLSHKVKFCRFVDDYRFFAPSIEVAHEWLTMFIERLHLEGLTINPLKTTIEDVSLIDGINKNEGVVISNRIKKHSRIVVGYSGTIPTKFREISEKEIRYLKDDSLDLLAQKINNEQILSPDDVKKFIKTLIAREEFDKIFYLTNFIDKFPQFTPLVIDVFIKKADLISPHIRGDIKNYFTEKITSNTNYPEYIMSSIISLLGKEHYRNISVLMEYFRNLKRNSGVYIGRAVLDALFNNVSRTEALEIRQYFNRADLWEKRAIIRLVINALPGDELRPWLKNIKIHLGDDLFAVEIFDKAKRK